MNKALLTAAAILICAMHMGFEWGQPQKKTKSAQKTSAPAPAAALPANATLGQMMNSLTQNMAVWSSLTPQDKAQSIEAAKLFFRDTQNTAILRPAEFYAQQIDDGLRSNPDMVNADIMTVLRMMAIVEYDFYNGQNKDALAREVLGDKVFESLKKNR